MEPSMHAHGLNRRAFMGLTAIGAAHWALQAAPETAAATRENTDMKPCRYWMHGFGGDDPKETARKMREAGFDVVVSGGAPIIEAVRENGMESWLCGGAFGLGGFDDDAHKAKDVLGRPQIWFGSGSPNDPEIRAKNLESYQQMAATPGIQGILVDGCRFASPASGIGPFFTDFSDHSKKKAAELGFDFKAMHHDARAAYDLVMARGRGAGRGPLWLESPVGILEWLTEHPGLLEWFRFRRVCSTGHFRAISEIIHAAKLRMGVYIFTPSLAPLVGQNYADLLPFMDVYAPMIYRNYPDRPGPACLNWELAIIPEEMGLEGTEDETAAMSLILSWTGLKRLTPSRRIAEIRAEMPPESVGHETAMARELIGPDKELAPIIYIDDPQMAKTAESVRQAGANGINFFVYKEAWADMVRPAILKES